MLGVFPLESLMVIALTCAALAALSFAVALTPEAAGGDRARRFPAPATSTAGDDAYLADVMFGAERDRRDAEAALELVLDRVYGRDGWRHWETDLRERSIHVWGVAVSEAAAAELVLAGFHAVVQHHHDYREFVRCTRTGEMRAA